MPRGLLFSGHSVGVGGPSGNMHFLGFLATETSNASVSSVHLHRVTLNNL